MGTKAVEYYSNDCLDCGVLPQDVELCVPSSILAPKDCPAAAGEDDFTYHTLTASLVKAEFLGPCASQKYKYTFTYDDTQIADGQVFTAAMIVGAFCKGCFTQWVEDQVGNESYIRNNQDGSQDYISPHGCAYRIVTGPGSITVDDTNSIDLALTGGVITADSNLSATAGNQVAINSDGLFVPKGAGLTITDTNSVDLTLSSGALSADVKISATAGNEITVNSDGIFAPTGSSAFITAIGDTSTVNLTETAGTLTADVKVSSDAGNNLSTHSDGLYVPPVLGISALANNQVFDPPSAAGLYQVSGSKAQLYNPNKFFSAGDMLWWMDADNQQQMVSSVPGPPVHGNSLLAFFSNDGRRFLFETGSGDSPSWQGFANTTTPPRRRGSCYSTGTNPNFASTDATLIGDFNGATKLCVAGVVQISTGFAFRTLVGLLGAAAAEILICGFDFASTVHPEMRCNTDLAHATTVTASQTFTANKVTPIIYEWDLAAATATIWMNGVVTSVNGSAVSIAGAFNSALLQTLVLQVYINATFFFEHFVWKDAFMTGAEKTAWFAEIKARYGNVTY